MQNVARKTIRMVMKIARVAALLLAVGAAGGAWATECLFSNVDQATTAATKTDGSYGTKSFAFQLSNPSGSAVNTTTFPSTGAALITQISLAARANNADQTATTVRLTGASGRVFTGTVKYLQDSTFTGTLSNGTTTFTRRAILILFDDGAIPVNVTETYTLAFYNSSGSNVTMGYSVVANGSNGWKPAMRIYGATLDGGAVSKIETQTTVSSTGVALLSGGTSPRFTVFMRVSAIPQSSGRILAWKEGGNNEMYLAKTATGFEQKWMNSSGTVQSGTYGTSTWTYDSGEHWIATTYSESVKNSGDTDISPCFGSAGSYSYIDGTCVAPGSGLRFRGNGIATLTIGGANLNDTDVATDMVIEEAYHCSEALTAAQVATVTTALQKGWKPTSSGTALTGTSVQLPNRTETVSGTITVAADGSYKFFGTMPSSLITSSGGVGMPSTVTVSGSEGVAIANDGTVTMGGAGSIQISTSTRPVTVMMKVEDIPSTQCVLAGITLANSKGMTFTRTATGFQNGEASGTSISTNNGNDWGAASTTTVSDGAHWLTLTYEHTANGTHSYMDGASVACSTANNGLRYSGSAVSTVSIGGSTIVPLSNYTSAKGMVIKDVQIYSSRLTAGQVATITAALNKGWTPDAIGTTLSGTDVVLPDSDAHVTGQIAISSDGSYTFSGALQVLSGTVMVTSGTTLTSVAAGATVLVNGGAPANLEEAIAGGYALSATLTVPETVDGTIALVDSNGNEATGATSAYENGVRSFTGTAPANSTYTGSAWWWDYEFDEDYGVNYTSGGTTYRYSMPNTGSADTTMMSLESLSNAMYTDADASGNREIYFQQTPWRDASFNSLTNMTAVMYCQPGNYANTVLVGFGSTTASGKTAIALVTGDNPANGDMKLVLVAGDSQTVTSLATLKAVDATTKKHLYAFVMDRITEDETEKTRVRVYLDGKVKAIYKHSGTLALSNGFQIGSLHGGVLNSGFSKYTASGDSGTLDFLRVFNGSLSDSAMAALADAYKYESAHGEATRDAVSAAASWVATGVWTQTVPEEDDATQDAPNADTNVTLSKGGSSDVAVDLNLASDSNYESLTLTKEAGASGTLKLVSGYANQTSGKLVAAATSILVDTVIPAGRANLGITSIGDGVTLTVDPFSVMGNYAILSELEQLGPGGVFEDIVISMAILGKGASVVLDSTGVSDLAAAGFTATLTYNESNQSYTFRVARSAAADVDVTISQTGTTWKANDVGMPVQTEMPSTYTGTVTIYNISGSAATVDTTFAGGNLVVAASKTINDNSLNTSSVTLTGAIATSGTVTFNGSVTLGGTGQAVSSAVTGSGAVTVSGSVNLTGSIANTVAGNGTITLSSLSQTLTFGAWTGTVWLKNISSGNIVPANYGNANSTIKFTGVTGTIAQDATFTPAVELEDEGDTKALTIDCTTGYAVNTATFSAIKGSGTFVTSSSTDQYPRTTFKVLDWSNFTGALNIDRGRLVFGTDTISADSWRYIYVSAGVNVTIASGKTWNATEGVVVKGTLNMPSTASMTVNKYSGDGTVNITGTPANDPSLTFSSWTGTFVLPDFTSNAMFNLTAYGTSGSWIKLNDFSPGWLKVAALSISANLLLEGDFILTAMNGGSAFSFQTVSGSGNISLTSSAAPASITIANLAEFTGSIANSSGASLVITKRTLAEAPSVDDCILVSSTPDNVSIVGVYVGDTKQDIIIGKKSDGIYVAATAETETVGGDTVTVLDTGLNTAVDASSLSGKVAIPGTVTQISGVEAANLLLKVTYTPDGGDSTTGYYAGILTLDNSGNVSLDGSATVGGVKVQPETAEDSPMTFTGSSPSFTVKTIPGLWYQVLAADSVDGGALVSPVGGTAVQATTSTVSPAAPAFTGTVKFYKIAVGASRAALQ